MILANVRQHLTRDDAQLALRLIARGSSDVIESAELTLREQGIDGEKKVANVKAMTLEPSGKLSVVKIDPCKPDLD